MKIFAEIYRELIGAVLNRGFVETNRRTATRILQLPEGASFCVDLRHDELPTCGLRKTRPHVAAAEAAWALLGHVDVLWLRKWTRTWDKFCDDCEDCRGE